jgi:hypothetical protein
MSGTRMQSNPNHAASHAELRDIFSQNVAIYMAQECYDVVKIIHETTDKTGFNSELSSKWHICISEPIKHARRAANSSVR